LDNNSREREKRSLSIKTLKQKISNLLSYNQAFQQFQQVFSYGLI